MRGTSEISENGGQNNFAHQAKFIQLNEITMIFDFYKFTDKQMAQCFCHLGRLFTLGKNS
jgi:hypothetical protein